MMTVGLFEAFVAEMEPLRAGRILDMAQAAAAVHQKSEWWDRLIEQAQGVGRAVAQQASGFMLNGKTLGFEQLHHQLSRLIGSGVSN